MVGYIGCEDVGWVNFVVGGKLVFYVWVYFVEVFCRGVRFFGQVEVVVEFYDVFVQIIEESIEFWFDWEVYVDVLIWYWVGQWSFVVWVEEFEYVECGVVVGVLYVVDDFFERFNCFGWNYELVLQEVVGVVVMVLFVDEIQWLVELCQVFDFVMSWCVYEVVSFVDCYQGEFVYGEVWEDVWNGYQLWCVEFQWIFGQFWCEFFELCQGSQGIMGDGGMVQFWFRGDDVELSRGVGVVVF